ncbi:bifunctional metallophosphatase/5'-nucleotidase [Streptomyces sp. NPDC059928]|uniref:bifunctional metallophosphatase/5'-nucleotidase n=1 Tax=unclassified Streptomyces TaxID=2593676 RepID=UPI00366251EA
MTGASFERIVATTDFHSSFAALGPMASYLRQARRTGALVVDCGDFFEGTGYYQLGAGDLERRTLAELYDVLAPGNHGWGHHFEPELRSMTVCANAVDADGRALFQPLRIVSVGGRRVAVTAVIGMQAFATIPPHQRVGQRVTDPARALRSLFLEHHHEVDAWVVLSHSGFDEDLRLARACPFLDVVFAGHCHSDQHGPQPVGDTLVVKGPELGAGFACAEPVGHGWAARTGHFPPGGHAPAELASVVEQIASLDRVLSVVLGPLDPCWAGRVPGRRELLNHVTSDVQTALGAGAVVLNETALRPTLLSDHLTAGNLLAVEPFGNQLVRLFLPDSPAGTTLLSELAERAGPLVTAPDPLPASVRIVVTTDYLAAPYPWPSSSAGLSLSHAVQHTLLAPSTDPEAPR